MACNVTLCDNAFEEVFLYFDLKGLDENFRELGDDNSTFSNFLLVVGMDHWWFMPRWVGGKLVCGRVERFLKLIHI